VDELPRQFGRDHCPHAHPAVALDADLVAGLHAAVGVRDLAGVLTSVYVSL
jgi:hypothetical protein